MSVSSSTSTISYAGNGSTSTAYTVPFVFFNASDLKVYSVNAAGVSTLLTITTNYTVSGGGGSTGSVTTTAAIPSSSTVLIQRVVPYTQLTSFTTGDRLPANSIETALDKLTMETQQLSRNTIPDTAATTGSAPYVLGIQTAGGSPAWVSQSSSGISDGSITAAKLSTGHPTWDGSGNLSAISFVGPLTGAVTGNVTGNVTGDVTGNLTGTASAIADGSVSLAKLVTAIQQSLIPSGAVQAFAMTSAPSGWLQANGSDISRSVYSALFAAIGTTYGAGDGSTTFSIPDLRGYFVRGSGINADATASGTFGAKQADSFQGHYHAASTTAKASGSSYAANGSNYVKADASASVAVGNPTTDGSNGDPRTANETRPKNIAMLYCIKY
jgi:microcystin-dependent protein